MKVVVELIFFLIAVSLGFIVNIFMPMVSFSIYQFVGIIWGVFCLVGFLLLTLKVLDDCDSLVEFGMFGSFVSMLGGSYYYVSEGLEHWIIGLFPGFFIFMEMALITIPIGWFFNLVDDISFGINHRSSGSYSSGGSYSGGSSYSSNSYSNNKKSSYPGFTKTYYKDRMGNTVGEATKYGVGGKIKEYTGISAYTEYKDKHGQNSGSSTTYDLGYGIKKTIYKDKDGNETESTSYKWW